MRKAIATINAPLIFSQDNFHCTCDEIAAMDADFDIILRIHGYPPMWTRPNNFETLVHIILEQKVTPMTAFTALSKLREKLGRITPERILALSDKELRVCAVSHQKSSFLRGLAKAITTGAIDFDKIELLSNDEIRQKLTGFNGLTNWAIDIYLMFVLRRIDIFPIHDLAAVNAILYLKNLPATTTTSEILDIVAMYRPYRTVACMMLWHYYLSNSNNRVSSL